MDLESFALIFVGVICLLFLIAFIMCAILLSKWGDDEDE